MKKIIPILAAMFLVGCGNNSMNQSSSTNSASGAPSASSDINSPPTNNMNNNGATVQMTNTPAITNDVSTNLPATTNQ
jgi:hypothetical protein